MRGNKTYTQHSVAFPHQPIHSDRFAYDRVGINFGPGKDGDEGTYAEMNFLFVRFGPHNDLDDRQHHAVKIECYTDGVGALLDPSVEGVLTWFNKLGIDRRSEVTPAKLIAKLEAVGFKPSTFHKNPI